MHRDHDLGKSERSVHHIKFTARFKTFCCRGNNIFQITQNLVPCDSFGSVRVLKPMTSYHIRRIACYYIKRSSSEYLTCLFNIALNYFHPISEVVKFNTSIRHFCALGLNFQSYKLTCFSFCRHQYRYYAGSRSQVKHSSIFRRIRKS